MPPPLSMKKRDLSPPTYSVESGKNGELYNWKYQLIWPHRPRHGPYSIQHELQLRSGKRLSQSWSGDEMQPEEAEICVTMSDVAIDNLVAGKSYKMMVCPNDEKMTEYLIRSISVFEATMEFRIYQKRNFLIYYQISSRCLGNVNSIPLEVPLMIASKGKDITHYRIKCYVCKDASGSAELWCAVELDLDEIPKKKNWHLGFASLEKLLSHYCSLNAKCVINANA